MSDVQTTVGRLIEKARAKRGLTLKALAGLSNLDVQVIHRLERGTTKSPHSTTLAALAPHLDLDLDQLLDAVGQDIPTTTPAEAAQ